MLDFLRSLLREPRVPDPPEKSRWDLALVVVLLIGGIIGAIFEPDVDWRPLAAVASVLVLPAILVRRKKPLGALALTMAVVVPADVVTRSFGDGTAVTAATGIVTVVLVYHLFRWASGREITIGMGLLVAWLVLAAIASGEYGETLGGLPFWGLPGSIGAVLRYRQHARRRGIEEARATERERLARELHDTVAHHVSAIVIQAQAGRAQAATRPEAAVDVLGVIEDAASRTLADMRRMVGSLRADGPAALAPQAGLADIERLAGEGAGPAVQVTLTGELDGLSASMEASLYRLAQESITNARRHARNATHIAVEIEGLDDHVRLRVLDDGDVVGNVQSRSSGFGLVGMSERASLLGGTLDAGPGPGRGWLVDATLPRREGSNQ